jgi:hypothetical protein
MAMMDKLGPAMATLDVTLDGLAKQVQLFYQTAGKKGKSLPEALGEALGSLFKAIASMFDPNMTKGATSAVDKFFQDFGKGFGKVDGEKYIKIIMDGLTNMITHLLFTNGNLLQPTAIAKALAGLTALFAAPVILGAVVTGLAPLILAGMLKLFGKTFEKVTPMVVNEFGKTAKLGAKIPGIGAIPEAANALKMKAVGAGAAGIVAMETHAPGLLKVGQGIAKVSEKIPVLGIALAGLDFASRKASGERTSTAAGGAAGNAVTCQGRTDPGAGQHRAVVDDF